MSETNSLSPRELMAWLLTCETRDEMHDAIRDWMRANPVHAPHTDGQDLHKVLAELAEIPRRIVAESGLPGASEVFDAEAWLNQWAHLPHPALGEQRPIDLLRTPGGVAQVRQLLEQQQSGAYA